MPADSTLDTQHAKLNITILSAGAGSGKTYTLTGRMVDLLKSGVRPRGIIATTFTQKAAAELQERVRARLLGAGMVEAANELGSALIGTVHSIGVRLLQRFAFEAGVSPLVEIIAVRHPRANIAGVELEDTEAKVACKHWVVVFDLLRGTAKAFLG